MSLSTESRRLLFTAASWVAFSTLAVEVLFARQAASYFGSGIAVFSSIIAVLLLAMAFGYLYGGRFSERDSLRLSHFYYGVALFAITLLPPVVLVDSVLPLTAFLVPDPRYGSLLASMIFIAAAGFVSGALSPVATRLIVTSVQEAGSRVGQLNAATTVGSALGTVIPAYYLVLWLEIRTIIALIAGVTIACALIGIVHTWIRQRDAQKLQPA